MLYPATPHPVNEELTRPSASFRKEVGKVLLAIFFFLLVYLLLLFLSVLLTIACFYGGIKILTAGFSIFTVLGGLGLMGVGVMVFIFLVKFIFSFSRTDRSSYVEVTEAEQPALFAFIRQLTADTQTPFPKRIYLSNEVNAAVFYDSGFWSMFFPVRKNLLIGLGLVNAINLSEFKGIMAHEFGHFSQLSMKLGSYVYQVNRIIYNMLYDNSGYTGFLQGWAEIHGIFAIFAMMTAKIAQLIQWILRSMYGLLNKSYLSLSREMEFHADTVAAVVSGSESLVSGLRRVELAAAAHSFTLEKCDELIRDKKRLGNLFIGQSAAIRMLADKYKLPVKDGLPVISEETALSGNTSRVNFKDQWASHPSTSDRVSHLRDLNITAAHSNESAWVLFKNREELEKGLTEKVYEPIPGAGAMEQVDASVLEEQIKNETALLTLPVQYNGFYNDRTFPLLDIEAALQDSPPADRSLVLNSQAAGLTKSIQLLENDMELVRAIAEKRMDIKTFDFEGLKYKQADAPALLNKMELEMQQLKEAMLQSDKQALAFFLQAATARGNGEALKNLYAEYYAERKSTDAFLEQINKVALLLQPVFAGQTITAEQAGSLFYDIRHVEEPPFKRMLREWVATGAFSHDPVLTEDINRYLNAAFEYYHDNGLFESEVLQLHGMLTRPWEAVNRYHYLRFKKLLELQWEMAGQ